MRPYNVCAVCGANLDAGEKCNCMEKKNIEQERPRHLNMYQKHRENYEAVERGRAYGNTI